MIIAGGRLPSPATAPTWHRCRNRRRNSNIELGATYSTWSRRCLSLSNPLKVLLVLSEVVYSASAGAAFSRNIMHQTSTTRLTHIGWAGASFAPVFAAPMAFATAFPCISSPNTTCSASPPLCSSKEHEAHPTRRIDTNIACLCNVCAKCHLVEPVERCR